jgi:hypothetical protein
MADAWDRIKLLVEVPGSHLQQAIPAGTEGVIVEKYSDPEGYAVDIALLSEEYVGGHVYDNVIVYPGQFIVVRAAADSPTLRSDQQK